MNHAARPSARHAPEPDLHLGLLAIRNEFLNLSELKHCLELRQRRAERLGDVLVAERYLTRQELDYLHMVRLAGPDAATVVTLADIEAEFETELATGAEFGRFSIVEELGRGAMGVVFRALDVASGEEVALKVLRGQDERAVRAVAHFKTEATVMMPLEHRSIARIHEVSREKGLDYIAMEYVEGKNLLATVDAEGAFEPARALAVIRSAAEAVVFIHQQGILHRDIKPQNIMLRPDGSAVLVDFGCASWEKIEVQNVRGSIGTPLYQPPEQAELNGRFGRVGAASDVYGLGATLYFLLTARHPFLGTSREEVDHKVKCVPPDPPRALDPRIPAVVEAICLRCLEKRPCERFPRPRDLIEAIDRALEVLDARGDSREEPEPVASGRAPTVVVAGFVVAILAVLVGIGLAIG